MRTSPWIGLSVVLGLLGLAAWSIVTWTGRDLPTPALSPAPTEPSTGETLLAGHLGIRATPGLRRVRLEDPLSDFVTELDLAPADTLERARRLPVRLPRCENLELLLDAEWQEAPTGPVALTLELELPGQTRPARTFWSRADEQGEALVSDLVTWNTASE